MSNLIDFNPYDHDDVTNDKMTKINERSFINREEITDKLFRYRNLIEHYKSLLSDLNMSKEDMNENAPGYISDSDSDYDYDDMNKSLKELTQNKTIIKCKYCNDYTTVRNKDNHNESCPARSQTQNPCCLTTPEEFS